MNNSTWASEIGALYERLRTLIDSAGMGDTAHELAAEALEELTVAVEELNAQNAELEASHRSLERERERYQLLFETIPDGFAVTDANGVIREANATAAALLGVQAATITGKPLGALISGDDQRSFYLQLRRLRDRLATHVSIEVQLAGSPPRPGQLRGVRAHDTGSGSAAGEIRWLIRDPAEDIATRDLSEREAQLRSLFNSADVGIMLFDPGGAVVFANDRAVDILDREIRHEGADALFEAAHPEDRPSLREAFESAVGSGEARSLRHRLDGSQVAVRWVDHGLRPVYGPEGGRIGVVSTLTDVTAEHHASTELAASRDFLDAVIDTVGALVVVLDATGRVQRFNAMCEQVSGLRSTEIMGESVIDLLVPADQRDEVLGVFEALVSGAARNTFENDWLTTAGERRTISWTNTTMRSPTGELVSVIATGIDITETQRLRDHVARSDRLASMGRLTAGIAHDINNTLSTLRLRLDRIAARVERDMESVDDIGAATRTIDHARRVIGDLLTFGGQERLAPEPMDINAEVERIMGLLADYLGDRISVELHLDASPSDAFVDPARFEQALTNLAVNAGDAMRDCGRLSVSTAFEEIAAEVAPAVANGAARRLDPGSYIRVTVEDTGIGIAPSDITHVFDPYFTTKPATRGTGLGLATTYGTIIQSGGDITVVSEPGVGTMFTMWLPRRSASTQQPTLGGAGAEQPPVCLVVEDDDEMREIVAEELRILGCEVTAEASGEEGLRHLGSEIELLITDVQLPGIGGVELARRLQEAREELRVIYISGAPNSVLERVVPPEAVLLKKPFSMAELRSLISAS